MLTCLLLQVVVLLTLSGLVSLGERHAICTQETMVWSLFCPRGGSILFGRSMAGAGLGHSPAERYSNLRSVRPNFVCNDGLKALSFHAILFHSQGPCLTIP